MRFTTIRTLGVSLAVSALLAPTLAYGQQKSPGGFDALPDWSGICQMQNGTIFDASTVEPKGGRSGDANVRERPPLQNSDFQSAISNLQ